MFFQIYKNNASFFLLLIIFSTFYLIKPKKIVFPFKTEISDILSSNYIDKYIQNKIYITTEIGSPP